MRAELVQPDIAGLLRPLSGADIFARPSSAVLRGALRLEAGFYGSEGYRAVQAMEKSGFEIGRVGDLAQVRWLGPFGRTYVDDPAAGVPFLSSSEMMMVKLEPKNFVSKAHTSKLHQVLVEAGTIMVSRSGTIGNVAICTKDYAGVAVSEHAIRVDPTADIDRGFLYAFLLSELGQFLITRNKSGSVIESIYAADVAGLPLPLLPKALRRELSAKIQRACNLRVRANARLDESDAAVAEDCNLPRVDSFAVGGAKNVGAGIAYAVSSADRLRFGLGFGQLRIDATFHEPTSVKLAKHILSRKDGRSLRDVLLGVRNSALRKRAYVDDPQDGVPMLGGKQLVQWRPREIKFLSKVLTRNLSKELLEDGWTLVSCGGTLGRTLYVHRNVQGGAASQHVMRIMPNHSLVFPGFVFAYLSSAYGQCQIQQRSYGSVIPEIRDFQFNSIAIVIPRDKGKAIHDLVVQAYDDRADAKSQEDEVLRLFIDAIKNGRAATEDQWGREY